MQFNKDTILNRDIGNLSNSERRDLINKYFPETEPEWKKHLRSEWADARYKRLWETYAGTNTYGEEAEPYRIDHRSIVETAKFAESNEYLQIKERKNTVTHFTEWLMSLYLSSPNPRALQRGKIVERNVAKLAKPSMHSDWELIYADPLDEKPTPLKISGLLVNDKPIWGSPNLVYKNKVTQEILIVERKATEYPVPSDGWPNLRAQLWAYSNIDRWKDFDKITLIGEVWGMHEEMPRRRAILRWSHSDKLFNEQNKELFLLYGGIVNA